MKRNHIHWTEIERSKLIEHAARLIQMHNYSILDSVRHAQAAVLPLDRQRKLDSITTLGSDFVRQLKQRANVTYETSMWQPPTQNATEEPSKLDDLVQSIAEKIADRVKSEIRKSIKDLENELRLQIISMK